MSNLITVMVGLPGSGKSTVIDQLIINHDCFIYSTDNYIEQAASDQGLTYNQVFKDQIDNATKSMNLQLQKAIDAKQNIIWDQTNMTPKKRKAILSKISKSYKKICVVLPPPQNDDEKNELNRRLNSRPGKTIPDNIIASMTASYVEPSLDEGFDEIIFMNMKHIVERVYR